MDINALIAQGVQPTVQAMNPMQMMSMQEQIQNSRLKQQEYQQNQATMGQQLKLSQVAANPAFRDTTTGAWKPEGIQALSFSRDLQDNAIEHNQKLEREKAATVKEKFQIDKAQMDNKMTVDGYVNDNITDPARIAYADALKAGRLPKDAIAIAQRVLTESRDTAAKSGILHPEVLSQIPSQFDPAKFTQAGENYKQYLAQQKQEKAQALADRKEAFAEKKDARDRAVSNPADTDATVKAIGEGRETFSSLGIRGKEREKYVRLVNDAYPNYNEQDVKRNQGIINQYEVSGKPRQSIQSINAVSEHAETYLGLVKALKNNDPQTINKYKNLWSQQFGGTAPGNAEEAASIFAPEVVKAVLPGGGGVDERKAQEAHWKTALTGDQAESQINSAIKPMIKGQYDALKQGYDSTGRDINKLFTTGAKKFIGVDQPKPSGGNAPADAIAHLKSNPALKDAFKAKYGYLPDGM